MASTKPKTSVGDIQSVLELSSAARQIRLDLHQSGQETGESLAPVLGQLVNSRLDSLDLLTPNLQRDSVIARHSSRPNSTSTPSCSPSRTPSVIQFLGPRTPTSPVSNLSSISGGDPFDDVIDSSAPSWSHSVSQSRVLPGVVVVGAMEDVQKKLSFQERKLRQKIKNFDLDRVTEDIVVTNKYFEKLEEIENLKDELVFALEDFLEDFSSQLSGDLQINFKNKIDKLEADVKKYCIDIQTKAAEVRKSLNSTNTTVPVASRSEVVSHSVAPPGGICVSDISSQNSKKIDAAKIKAKAKWDLICSRCNTLTDKARAFPDWSVESDLVISRAMKDIKSWEEETNKISDLYQELTEHLIDWDISEVDSGIFGAKEIIDGLQCLVLETIGNIKNEDDSRALYTLDSNKHDLVKYPTYQGLDSEDFSLFKSKVEKAFETNRVIMSDRVAKLRSCLKGNALSLVPESSVKSISEAWSALEAAYGAPERLMRSKKEAINKLGCIPKENSGKGQPNFKNQINWYLQLESLILEVIELGKKSVDLEKEAFSPSHINSIIGLFRGANTKMLQLAQCPGSGSSQLAAILAKISAMRSDAQKLLNITQDADQISGDTGLHASSGQRRSSKSSNSNVRGLVAYNPPKKDNDCRICKVLESEGDTINLYEDHHHNYPTGCPRYITMTIVERYRVACKAKLCLKCHDPSYMYKRFDKNHKCAADSKKTKFSCKSCSYHMWICHRHQADNNVALNKFKEEELRKHNLEFGLFVAKLQQTVKQSIPTSSPSDVSVSQSVQSQPPLCEIIPEADNSSKSCHNDSLYQNLSQNQALSKLKRKLNSKLETRNVKLNIAPKGRSQFLLGQSQGKTRPITTLYDTGCSSALFQEGVPQTELSPAVLMTRGPFMVNGVGDTQVKVNDLWMCSVPLRDGSRQPIEGWAVDKVTGTFPLVKMKAAEEQIKADNPNNKTLQSLQSPPTSGGNVDILLGIAYSAIFPERIHMLESGLAIYELKMSPHVKGFNAVIGGPSEHFEALIGHVGCTSLVFANLLTQLDNYKQMGPPQLSRTIMTSEDLDFARQHKDWGLDSHCEELLDNINLDEIKDYNEVAVPLSTSTVAMPQVKNSQDIVSCGGCGETILGDAVRSLNLFSKYDETDSIQQLRMKAQNEGISIEYRCPRCRSCTDCKRSFETERVSLREETEDFMIYESVNIDWEKNRIVCSFPMRGSEEEFLTSNRDIALRVLNQQCNKYKDDKETKATIKKAFDKLITNGQMIPFNDLTNEQKDLILSKPVNYWIPWRVVFKVSLSTPCRPVFDASSNTKPRENGTGGRSLNDLVVKGRVVTLNLIRMLMRFTVGGAAVQGDLAQFYASIKLLDEFWNLQRVLYKENLDPDAEAKEFIVKTLIWGVKCVSAQSECALLKLADIVEEHSPRLAAFLRHDRFVDDLAGSDLSIENIKILVQAADSWFSRVNLACKGWTFSFEDPPEQVSEGGHVVSVGGLKWHSKLDLIEVALPDLHFSTKARGRLAQGTQVFKGSTLSDLDKFVPQNLTRRQVFSKNGTIFDPLGKLIPITAGLSLDLRESVKSTISWDDCIGVELRNKWLKNFLRIEKMKGLKCFSVPSCLTMLLIVIWK